MTTAAQVVQRRRSQRRALIAIAREFATSIDPACGLRAVVVFGSVARGDFNDDSDIDVLVIADDVPTTAPERLHVIGLPPHRVEVVAWTSREWLREQQRGNPIAAEAETHGVWLTGTPREVGQPIGLNG